MLLPSGTYGAGQIRGEARHRSIGRGESLHEVSSTGLFLRELDEGDNRALMIVLMAAASYLAMRAVKLPRYMGRDVGSDDGWQALMAHFERIIDRVAGDVSPAEAPTDNS